MEPVLVSPASNFSDTLGEAGIPHHRAEHTRDLAVEKSKEEVRWERKEV